MYKNELFATDMLLLTSVQSKLCRVVTIFKSSRSLIIIGCTHAALRIPYLISLFVEVLCFILFSLWMVTNLTISKRKIAQHDLGLKEISCSIAVRLVRLSPLVNLKNLRTYRFGAGRMSVVSVRQFKLITKAQRVRVRFIK